MKYNLIAFLVIVGIFSITLSSAAWTADLNVELRSYWKLNETGSGARVDSVGYLNGTVTGAMNTTLGKIGFGIEGNGSNRANFTRALASTDTFTLSTWIQKSGAAANFNFRWMGDTTTNQLGVNYNDCAQTSQDAISVTTNTECTNVVNASVAGSGYRHLVIIAGADVGNRQLVYVDGVLITNKSGAAFTNLSNNFLMLSTAPNSMLVDEVGFWTLPLTGSQITNLYNAGTGITYTADVGPSVILNSPANASIILTNQTIFNSTLSVGSSQTLRNATLNLWFTNGTIALRSNVSLSGIIGNAIFNITNLTNLGSYRWNVFGCSSNNICNWANSNFTFTLGSFDEDFETTLIEGQSTGISLNITFDGVNQNLLASLNWNNTLSTPTKEIVNSTRIRFTSNFVVPVGTGNITGRPITHYWRFYLPDGTINGTTTNQTQNVFSLGIDNCSTFTDLLFNYTMYDEDTITLINGTATNASIEVEVNLQSLADPTQTTNLSRTYSNTNNARVCISEIASGFRVDSQVRYTASSYVVEFYNIQNSTLSATNFPQHIGLYPLLSSRSQEFLVTYKDENFVPLEDALITVTRKYIGEGLFRTVEGPLTNEDGQALVHLVLGDVIYTIQVSKDGELLGTFDNIVPFCTNVATGECTINLNSFSTGIPATNFNTINNLSYAFTFNKTTRTLTSIFTTTDGSVALINLTGVVFDNRGNNTACTTSVQTSSGSLSCVIPVSIGNTTVRATLYKNGQFITNAFVSLTDADDTNFGTTGIVLMLLMYLCIGFMFIGTPEGIVIGSILGFIFAALLNLYNHGGIIGITGTIIWLIVAGAILLWQINKLRNR